MLYSINYVGDFKANIAISSDVNEFCCLSITNELCQRSDLDFFCGHFYKQNGGNSFFPLLWVVISHKE